MLKTAIIAAALLLITGLSPAMAADPPSLPAGVTCELVRAKVAEHGWGIVYGWARLNGFSAKEIAEARRCLK